MPSGWPAIFGAFWALAVEVGLADHRGFGKHHVLSRRPPWLAAWQRCLRLFADRYKVGKGKVKAIEPGTGQKSLRSRNVYETPFHRNIAMLLRGPR